MGMKVGILTLPLNTNYGGILQAFALQRSLRKMRQDPYLIVIRKTGLRRRLFAAREAVRTIVRNILKGERNDPFFHYRKEVVELERTYSLFDSYSRGFVKRKRFDHYDSKLEKAFDCFIVGSDQIWRPDYVENIGASFFDFVKGKDKKLIAYAPSFGSSEWLFSPQQTEAFSELLSRFDGISVREAAGVQMVKNHFHKSAIHVLDPTLLLDRSEYDSLIDEGSTVPPEGEMMVHLLDASGNAQEIVSGMSAKYGMKPFSAGTVSVRQWLRCIRESKLVITDSFHACVFSIIFRTPFITVGNAERGTERFESLLGQFGLQNHFRQKWDESMTMDEFALGNDVYEELERSREKSLLFLFDAIVRI